jgi:tetratricopeptide (TPR) repeat protein
MADSGRDRGSSQGAGKGRPAASGRPDRSGRSGQSAGRGSGAGRKGSSSAGSSSGGRGGRPAKERYTGVSSRREDREPRTADQATYDGPDLPDDITGKELDRNVLAQLRGLPEKLAARVARHLVAAGQLLDSDPEKAYQHTLAARARASRVAVIREATGEAAYAAGHFTEALAELRAAKRMNGAIDYLPVMADCERALGRPERALALAKSPSVAKLPMDQQIEMTIVEAGARFDLGEVDSALRTLENAPIRSVTREGWLVRLRYAYADLLLKAGRRDDAIEWFHRTAGIDGAAITDAAERILELEGVVVEDTED